MIDSLLKPSAVAFLVCYVATALVISLASRIGVLDDPRHRMCPARLHDRPVPRGGGIALFVAVAMSCWAFLPRGSTTVAIIAGAFVISIIGLLDDRGFEIHPYWRLLGQLLAAALVVATGVTIARVSNPFGGVIDLTYPSIGLNVGVGTEAVAILPYMLGIVWIVALMNVTSWSSGVDGQMSGLVAIAALIVAVKSIHDPPTTSGILVVTLAAITGGAYLGFVPWHVYPQKIMPGFGGGTLAGYLLATLSMLGSVKVGTLALILAIPVADAAWTILRRLLQGKNPVWGDNRHLHHRLLAIGWSKRAVALFYWATTAALGLVVLVANTRGIVLTACVGGLVAVAALLLRRREAFEWRSASTPSVGLVDRAAADGHTPGSNGASIERPAGPVVLWRARVRAAIVAEVLSKRMTPAQACDEYGLRQDQLEDWTNRYSAFRKQSQS